MNLYRKRQNIIKRQHKLPMQETIMNFRLLITNQVTFLSGREINK